MGYFDGLTSSNFKTAQDGRKLYFPWGFWGRGYAVGSERDYEQLRRQLKIYHVITLVLIFGAIVLKGFIGGFVAAALLILIYIVWSLYLTASLETTKERLSLQESLASQARSYNVFTLWSLEITALVFVVGDVFLLVTNKNDRPLTLLGLIFFAFCAAAIACLLAARGPSTPTPR